MYSWSMSLSPGNSGWPSTSSAMMHLMGGEGGEEGRAFGEAAPPEGRRVRMNLRGAGNGLPVGARSIDLGQLRLQLSLPGMEGRSRHQEGAGPSLGLLSL